MSFGDEQPPPTTEERITRLNEHIERLRADRRPTGDEAPNVEDAPLYQMAALFRAATPGAADPDPTFAANLLARLEGAAANAQAMPLAPAAAAAHPLAPATGDAAADVPALAPIPNALPSPHSSARQAAMSAPSGVAPQAAPQAAPHTEASPTPIALRQERAARRRDGAGVSRRGLLAGGLGVAAAAVVGAVGGAAIERAAAPPGAASRSKTPLVQAGAGAWVAIAPVAEIPVGAVKHFQTEYIVGFIHHTAQGFSALSGVCTHMSCLLVWNTGARTFDCPCHGGRFTADGQAAASSPIAYSPLPAIETKVAQEQVWVYVIPPLTQTSPSPSSGGYGADGG